MNVQVQRVETPAELKLASQFAERKDALVGADTLGAGRAAAFARFEAVGLPHRRVEEFKYTDMRARLREVADAGETQVTLPDAQGGVRVTSLAEALASDGAAIAERIAERFTGFDSPLLDLNEAFASAGAVIDIAAGANVAEPVRAGFAHPAGKRGDSVALYSVGSGASVTLIEKAGSADGGAQGGHVSHVDVADGAKVTFIRHVDAGAQGVHSGGLAVTVGANATFDLLLVVSTGELVRTDIGLRFVGGDAVANLRGLHLAGSTRHVDTTLFVDHAEPGCVSRELFKSVLDDRARSVFQGKILVRQKAQKTDGKMMAQALMLSDDAEADSKPELEIYADDVQCGHGSTTGRVDDTLLFYLMARGIPKREATRMLVSAFAGEVFDDLDEAVAEEFSAVAEEWLERHLA
ncbi:MAG: Fe-S cluster assembly protein SufD [Rhodobiaceae bacterium]|nr:Fe-S cluster assembly protein SufD [Rhodobiaceae bacterium]MCC0041364.1 Fe-S cluster assembly protein SufD [Rhodobiaceae bacterium]